MNLSPSCSSCYARSSTACCCSNITAAFDSPKVAATPRTPSKDSHRPCRVYPPTRPDTGCTSACRIRASSPQREPAAWWKEQPARPPSPWQQNSLAVPTYLSTLAATPRPHSASAYNASYATYRHAPAQQHPGFASPEKHETFTHAPFNHAPLPSHAPSSPRIAASWRPAPEADSWLAAAPLHDVYAQQSDGPAWPQPVPDAAAQPPPGENQYGEQPTSLLHARFAVLLH